MLGSLGCPYDCSFCVDATVDYQTLPYEQIREDLVFLTQQLARPVVGWHDPNFGVRFDEYMDAIDAAVRPGSIRFVAESSLSLLTEPHVKALAALRLPGGSSSASRAGSASARRHVSARTSVWRRPRRLAVRSIFVTSLHPPRADELRPGDSTTTSAPSRSISPGDSWSSRRRRFRFTASSRRSAIRLRSAPSSRARAASSTSRTITRTRPPFTTYG